MARPKIEQIEPKPSFRKKIRRRTKNGHYILPETMYRTVMRHVAEEKKKWGSEEAMKEEAFRVSALLKAAFLAEGHKIEPEMTVSMIAGMKRKATLRANGFVRKTRERFSNEWS